MSCGHCGVVLVNEQGVSCPMCKGERYCGTECMKKAWTHHQSSEKCNAHFVDSDVTLATPTMYEDLAPTEVLDQLDESSFINQSYLMTTYNTDGTVTQRILPTIAGAFTEAPLVKNGATPVELPSSGTFKVTLEDTDTGKFASVEGDIPYNVISLDNVQNAHAERLAGTASMCSKGAMKPFAKGLQARSKYNTVLWPNPRAVSQAFKGMPINKDTLYDLSVQRDDGDASTQTFRFLLDKSPLKLHPSARKVLRQSKLGRFYTSMIKATANAGNVEIALDKSATYNLNMPDGSAVKLTVEMRSEDGREVPYLVNIEVMQGYSYYGNGKRLPRYNKTPSSGLPRMHNHGSGGVSSPYVHKIECDTSYTPHVGALYVALKDRVADYADLLDVMKSANQNPTCSLIRELEQKHNEYHGQLRQLESYYEKLHKEGPDAEKRNPHINMLVSKIMEDQYQYIGAKMKQENYMAKILKDGAQAGNSLADAVIERYQSAQEKIRQIDEDLRASKKRAASGGVGVKIKETAKRAVLNVRKGKAVLEKRAAEANMRDLIAALLDAQGSPLVNGETDAVVNELNDVISKLRNSKSRTGGMSSERGPQDDDDAMTETDTQSDDWDDNYGTRGKTNWSY